MLTSKIYIDHCINRNKSGLQAWYDRHYRSDIFIQSSRYVKHRSIILNVAATALYKHSKRSWWQNQRNIVVKADVLAERWTWEYRSTVVMKTIICQIARIRQRLVPIQDYFRWWLDRYDRPRRVAALCNWGVRYTVHHTLKLFVTTMTT
jgi:predicted P-loop ATPase